MERKLHIDLFGASALTGFALLLAFNQVVIKVTNGGLQPIFFAGLRSLGAMVCVGLWLWYRGIPLRLTREIVLWGVATGTVFAFEFLFLFVAVDLTTIGRVAVIFYSMPVWMALMAHWVLPDDRVSPLKALGLMLAVAGVAWAMLGRGEGEGSIWGDLSAWGAALGWAATALLAKASPLNKARPVVQLWLQVAVSGPLLIAISFLYGDLIRDLQPIHLAGLAFQIVVVVSAGFIFWLWLLSIYPASGVASFSFLSPVFTVILGWLMLGEQITPTVFGALLLVSLGVVLINRAPRSQVPQKV